MSASVGIDPELLREFLDESGDILSGLDPLFVRLEQDPSNLDTVNAIFRPVHTIKGNSAFFGLMKVKSLAHELETLMDMVRKKTLSVSRPLVDVLLTGMDELKNMLARTKEGRPEVADEAGLEALLARVRAQASGGAAISPAEQWKAVFGGLEALKKDFAPAGAPLAAAVDALANKLRALAPDGSVPATKPPDAPASPLERLLALIGQPIQNVLDEKAAATVLALLKELRGTTADKEAVEAVDYLLDSHQTMVPALGFDNLLREIMVEKLAPLSKRGAWSKEAAPAAPPAPAAVPVADKAAAPAPAPAAGKPAPAAAPAADGKETHKTMRVAESNIDTFLEYVGELLVVGDMFKHLQDQIQASSVDRRVAERFRHANETFASLSNNLQQSIMSIRKVPIKSLFQKVPRTVRDIAAKTGKDIAVEMVGEDVEVDKSLLDMLDGPLTHMVRNAADHGVEKPEARKASGKTPKGTMRICATEGDKFISLSVEDDGAGLNYDAIRAKGESLGLVAPGQPMTEADVVNLIFAAGVSTAKEITDVSGRGVGMDVVKRMIDESGGRITVKSERGKGSRFEVHVPKEVTTQIMPGFLVMAAGNRFVLPLDRVHETIKLEDKDVNTVSGKGRCILRHGSVLPIYSLAGILGLRPAGEQAPAEPIVVTLTINRRRHAMSVENVLGVQKVVSRPIEGMSGRNTIISGGALMGDGSVALVVDVDRIAFGGGA